MKIVMLLLAVAVCVTGHHLVVPGPVAVRVPSHDSAIIQSHRLGGNFAYSTHEAHAYGVQTPIIGQRTVPVGVSYVPGAPVFKTSTKVITHQVPRYGLTYPHVGAYSGFPIPHVGAYSGFPIPNVGAYSGFPAPYVLSPAIQEVATHEVATHEVAASEPAVDTA